MTIKIVDKKRKIRDKGWVIRRINNQLDQTQRPNLTVYTADLKYCLPPRKLAKRIIQKSKVDDRVWDPDGTFDCDDFALVLKANFSQAAYARGAHGPYCFGIVWGMLPYPFPHALNWMINSDGKLRFVEPQTDRIFRPDAKNANDDYIYRNIYFMLV